MALTLAQSSIVRILLRAAMPKFPWAKAPAVLVITLVVLIGGVAVGISILSLAVELLHLL